MPSRINFTLLCVPARHYIVRLIIIAATRSIKQGERNSMYHHNYYLNSTVS